jgi:hypothetical protein
MELPVAYEQRNNTPSAHRKTQNVNTSSVSSAGNHKQLVLDSGFFDSQLNGFSILEI